jgi:hypothetical protein
VVGGGAGVAGRAEGIGEQNCIAWFRDGYAGANFANVAGAFVAEDSGVEGYGCCAVGEIAD